MPLLQAARILPTTWLLVPLTTSAVSCVSCSRVAADAGSITRFVSEAGNRSTSFHRIGCLRVTRVTRLNWGIGRLWGNAELNRDTMGASLSLNRWATTEIPFG